MVLVEAVLILALSFIMITHGFAGRRPALILFSLILILGHTIPIWIELILGLFNYAGLIGAREAVRPQAVHAITLTLAGTVFGYYLGLPARSKVIASVTSAMSATAAAHGRPPSKLYYLSLVNWLFVLLIAGLVLSFPDGVAGFLRVTFNRLQSESGLSSMIYALSVAYSVIVTLQLVVGLPYRKIPYVHIVLSLVVFWALGGRLHFVVTFLSYLLLCLRYNFISARVSAILTTLSLIPLNFIILLRLQTQGDTSATFTDAVRLTTEEVSMVDAYTLAVQYVEVFGHQYDLYLNNLLRLVPRFIYEDKPTPISIVFRQVFYGDDLGGIPPAMIGEFYIVGGLVLCLIGGFGYGLLLRMLDRNWHRLTLLSPEKQALLAVLLPIAAFDIVRVGFENSVFRIFVALIAYMAVATVASITAPRRVRRGQGARAVS